LVSTLELIHKEEINFVHTFQDFISKTANQYAHSKTQSDFNQSCDFKTDIVRHKARVNEAIFLMTAFAQNC